MIRVALAASALLMLAAGVTALPAPQPTYNTTIRVRLADPIDRRVFGIGVVPEEFYFSFQTTYKIRGQEVRPAVFWRTPLNDRTLQVKAVRRAGFWWVTRANLVEAP